MIYVNAVLINIKGLAERWNCTVAAIRKKEADGVITRVDGVPGVQFRIKDIEKLEGTAESPLSPAERRKLLRRIEFLEERNNELEKLFTKFDIEIMSHKLKAM